MNKAIKFRAWHRDEKIMYPIIFGVGSYLYWFEEQGYREWEDIERDFELMQYTGFKDARGEDLYDGDIFEDDAEWYRVGWSDEDGGWYAFGIRDKGGNVDMQLAEFAGSSTCWKQGNIYENPDLLKEGHE